MSKKKTATRGRPLGTEMPKDLKAIKTISDVLIDLDDPNVVERVTWYVRQAVESHYEKLGYMSGLQCCDGGDDNE